LGLQAMSSFVTLSCWNSAIILRTVQHSQPDEIYSLAAQSFVAMSFEEPIYTGAVDALGITRILEAIRQFNKSIRYYQVSTSEMFGRAQNLLREKSH
jgi:GDPmannose 4,6-dehydratase